MGNTNSRSNKTVIEIESAPGVVFKKDNVPHFKIVLLGDSAVGKTSVFSRYTKNQFPLTYTKTNRFAVENAIKTVNIPQKTLSSITLWDIPGSEDIDLRSTYFRNVDAAVVVVDLNDPDSIDLAGVWKQEFMSKATNAEFVKKKLKNGDVITELEEIPCDVNAIPILLMGNKYDLIEAKLNAAILKRHEEKTRETQDDVTTMTQSVENLGKKLGWKPKKTQKKKSDEDYWSDIRSIPEDVEKPEVVVVSD